MVTLEERKSYSVYCVVQCLALFWTPHFLFLDSTLLHLDSASSLDSTLKLCSGSKLKAGKGWEERGDRKISQRDREVTKHGAAH